MKTIALKSAPFGVLAIALAAMSLTACSASGSIGSSLSACDNPELQTALKDGIKTSTKETVTDTSNIQTVSKTDKAAVCKMHVKTQSGAEADITYNLTLDGTSTKFVITKVDEAGAAGGAAAAAAPADAPADAAKQ